MPRKSVFLGKVYNSLWYKEIGVKKLKNESILRVFV
jgi:hypothetical protein